MPEFFCADCRKRIMQVLLPKAMCFACENIRDGIKLGQALWWDERHQQVRITDALDRRKPKWKRPRVTEDPKLEWAKPRVKFIGQFTAPCAGTLYPALDYDNLPRWSLPVTLWEYDDSRATCDVFADFSLPHDLKVRMTEQLELAFYEQPDELFDPRYVEPIVDNPVAKKLHWKRRGHEHSHSIVE